MRWTCHGRQPSHNSTADRYRPFWLDISQQIKTPPYLLSKHTSSIRRTIKSNQPTSLLSLATPLPLPFSEVFFWSGKRSITHNIRHLANTFSVRWSAESNPPRYRTNVFSLSHLVIHNLCYTSQHKISKTYNTTQIQVSADSHIIPYSRYTSVFSNWNPFRSVLNCFLLRLALKLVKIRVPLSHKIQQRKRQKYNTLYQPKLF